MRIGRRMLGLTLMGAGLLTLGIGGAFARTFPRANPLDLQPGIREEGRYTEVIPRTYGKLHRLPSLYPGPGAGTVSSQSACGGCATSSPVPRMGDGRSHNAQAPAPISSRSIPTAENLSGVGSTPIANVVGSGAGSSRVDSLESSLRDVARKLNTR